MYSYVPIKNRLTSITSSGKTPDGCPRTAFHQSEPVDRGRTGASLGEAVSNRV